MLPPVAQNRPRSRRGVRPRCVHPRTSPGSPAGRRLGRVGGRAARRRRESPRIPAPGRSRRSGRCGRRRWSGSARRATVGEALRHRTVPDPPPHRLRRGQGDARAAVVQRVVEGHLALLVQPGVGELEEVDGGAEERIPRADDDVLVRVGASAGPLVVSSSRATRRATRRFSGEIRGSRFKVALLLSVPVAGPRRSRPGFAAGRWG